MEVTGEPLRHPLAQKFLAALEHSRKDGYVVTQPAGLTMPRGFLADAGRILDFPVRPDDVWVVSFPKSGTTWTQEMVWLLMNDLDFRTARQVCLPERSPFLEYSALVPEEGKAGIADTIELAQRMTSPRLIKSHLPPALLPKQLWTIKPKVIYVARNPKDAATSFYYHIRLMYDLKLPLEEYYDAFLANVVYYTPYWTNVLEFWKIRHESNILWNTYEEMKKDLRAVIRKTATFLGRIVTDEEVERLEEHLSFSSMRQNPATNYDGLVQRLRSTTGLPPVPQDLAFMREGEVGASRQRMSPEMDRRFDRWIQDNIRGTGYDGPI
ncbi:luciferin sulfotransferase-like [Schistocerca piceifrons]|uniref:luciferin sulfotransferase-like n=1 Tax=Schistocerca piceifrons TaxID=274613 RepID=UPI001F5F4FEF|nr:luciferin sulfotransferase-like [Schistocerca piceifrons]